MTTQDEPAAEAQPDVGMASTAPGIPDEALAPGQPDLPEPPSDEEVARMAKALGTGEQPKTGV